MIWPLTPQGKEQTQLINKQYGKEMRLPTAQDLSLSWKAAKHDWATKYIWNKLLDAYELLKMTNRHSHDKNKVWYYSKNKTHESSTQISVFNLFIAMKMAQSVCNFPLQ
jgi:hypothetical protein